MQLCLVVGKYMNPPFSSSLARRRSHHIMLLHTFLCFRPWLLDPQEVWCGCAISWFEPYSGIHKRKLNVSGGDVGCLQSWLANLRCSYHM
jgi:hypothetical protein